MTASFILRLVDYASGEVIGLEVDSGVPRQGDLLEHEDGSFYEVRRVTWLVGPNVEAGSVRLGVLRICARCYKHIPRGAGAECPACEGAAKAGEER